MLPTAGSTGFTAFLLPSGHKLQQCPEAALLLKAAIGTFGFYLENVSHPTQQNADQPLKLQLSARDSGELHEERKGGEIHTPHG